MFHYSSFCSYINVVSVEDEADLYSLLESYHLSEKVAFGRCYFSVVEIAG